jgi:hypothetical protein
MSFIRRILGFRKRAMTLPTEGLLLHAPTFNGATGRFLNTVADGEAEYVKPVLAKCATLTAGDEIAIYGVTGATRTSKLGTGDVTIGTNKLTVHTAGTLYRLVLTLADEATVVTFPLSEGVGTTVFGYDGDGVIYTGVITTSNITAFWAGTQSAYFHNIQYGYTEATNLIPNSKTYEAAVSGNILPAGWSKSEQNGLTATVVAVDTDSVDIKIAGTTTAAATVWISFTETNVIAGVAGDIFTLSAKIEEVAGNSSQYLRRMGAFSRNISAGYVTFMSQEVVPAEEELEYTFTVSGAATTHIQPVFNVYHGNTGATVDYTLRFSRLHLVSGGSRGAYIETSGTAVAGIVPGNPEVSGTDLMGNVLQYRPGYNASASYQVVGPDIATAIGGGGGTGLYREQLILASALVSTDHITVTESGGWYTASRVAQGSQSRNMVILSGGYSTTEDDRKLTWVVELKKKPGQTNTVALGFYQSTTFVTDAYSIVSGPGSIGVTSGYAVVSDLSESEVTTVKIVRNSNTSGTTVFGYFYPCSAGTSDAGAGCLFRLHHIWRGNDDRAYREPTTARYLADPPNTEQDFATGESVFFESDGGSKTLTYTQMLNIGVGPQIFFDTGGRGLAVFEDEQTGTVLERVVRYMRTVRDPVVIPDPAPDPQPDPDPDPEPQPDPHPSTFTYYITDHTASLNETSISSGQSKLNWSLNATTTNNNSIITHSVTLTSTTSATRACTLRYKIPISRTGLSWLRDDLKSVLAISGTTIYKNNVAQWQQDFLGPKMPERPNQLWAGVVNSTTCYALAVDPLTPVVFQLEYSSAEQALYVKFLLGFHNTVRSATFKFHEWQFNPGAEPARRIVSDIQNVICPTAFVDQIRLANDVHGAWYFQTSGSKQLTSQDISDFGMKLWQGGSTTSSALAHYAANGIWNVRYIYGYDLHLSNLPFNTNYATWLSGLNSLASGGDVRALASLNSGVHGEQGRLSYFTESWTPGQSRVIPNCSPGVLPQPNHYYSEFERNQGVISSTYRGVMVDNNPFFMWRSVVSDTKTMINYREGHFQYTQTPLSFDTGFRVGLHYEMMATEFMKSMTTWLRAQTKLHPAMANAGQGHSVFTFPWQDAGGGEASWQRENNVWSPIGEDRLLMYRIKLGKKPVMLVQNPWRWSDWTTTRVTAMLARSLCYGIFHSMGKDAMGSSLSTGEHYFLPTSPYPDRDRTIFRKYMPLTRELSHAGWQPIRNFTMSNSTIWGERFGDKADVAKTVYITCFNPSTTSSATFTMSSPTYSSPAPATMTELISGQTRSWSSGNMTITLGPETVQVFKMVYA